ncbi:MAG: CDP-alcohol phosphatidyltransferase family protein [Actinomycetaceae bacterium]|nr:CDP-alcohol phosphatidyltransferase family protein [Actinomycetaceae bacterium]
MLGEHGRGVAKAVLTPVAQVAKKLGLTPNMLTVGGTMVTVVAAFALIPTDHLGWAALALSIILAADSLDGTLARLTGKTSQFGAFLDSTLDRIADGAVFGSLTAWAALHLQGGAQVVGIFAGIAASVFAATVPYARARAQNIGVDAAKGIAERTDRLVIVGIGAILYAFTGHAWMVVAGLVIVALLSLITVIQRILVTWTNANE